MFCQVNRNFIAIIRTHSGRTRKRSLQTPSVSEALQCFEFGERVTSRRYRQGKQPRYHATTEQHSYNGRYQNINLM